MVVDAIVDHDPIALDTGTATNDTVPDNDSVEVIIVAAAGVRHGISQQNANIAILHGPTIDVHACSVEQVDADAGIRIARTAVNDGLRQVNMRTVHSHDDSRESPLQRHVVRCQRVHSSGAGYYFGQPLQLSIT